MPEARRSATATEADIGTVIENYPASGLIQDCAEGEKLHLFNRSVDLNALASGDMK